MKVKLTKYKKNDPRLIEEVYTFTGVCRKNLVEKCLQIWNEEKQAGYNLLPELLLKRLWDKIEII